eukprot:gene6348-7603_t
MYNYATLLALGDGVAEDKAAAFAWFERAAKLGNAKAINFVGSFHEDGWVVPRDLKRAARCYARAAQGGDVLAREWSRVRVSRRDDEQLRHQVGQQAQLRIVGQRRVAVAGHMGLEPVDGAGEEQPPQRAAERIVLRRARPVVDGAV